MRTTTALDRGLLLAALLTCFLLTVLPAAAAAAEPGESSPPLLWPEDQRAFWQDGPGWLLTKEQRRKILEADPGQRADLIQSFMATDPIPETPENELQEGIRRRGQLMRSQFLSPLDERARLLFMDGPPDERTPIDCGEAFKPLEIWRYGGRRLVLYRPVPGRPYRLWIPLDTKRVLYTDELEYWMEQWEELRGRIRGKRADRQLCPEAPQVDEATGVDGLDRVLEGRPDNLELLGYLGPPKDLAAWAREAATTELEPPPKDISFQPSELVFPERQGQRMVTRLVLPLALDAPLVPFEKDDRKELRLDLEGAVESERELFETFRLRYVLPPPKDGKPVVLVLERPLRPEESFLLRVEVKDEVGGAVGRLTRAFTVPEEPEAVVEPPVPDAAIAELEEDLRTKKLAGVDSLILVPPPSEVVFGVMRTEAIVTGDRITEVTFLLDGQAQLTRTKRPFSVELRLPNIPREMVLSARGLDAEGEVVASDEMLLNQPRGELKVDIMEPKRGQQPEGRFTARAGVVVPEGRRVERVEFAINERVLATREKPPWTADLEVPHLPGLVYLTVTAELDDGTRAEDVRFLRAPYEMEQMSVDLVELYTTVTDRTGQLVRGLGEDDFRILEDGRPQKIAKFELVEDLPLTIGITIDTSGSMFTSLGEAQRAAVTFLQDVVTPRDRCFAVGFSDQPRLITPRTEDVGAVEASLEDLRADGWTALHDAVVFSLYYFRGVRGRRALVLLSDGDDTDSVVPFRDALEFARRSGVAIYTIGLKTEALDRKAKDKLRQLAEETGGRFFFIDVAEELAGVYQEIEEELRSQYLLAYASDRPEGKGGFREVEVRVQEKGLDARTIRGYYP